MAALSAFPTEYQRRHSSAMEMEARYALGTGGSPRGRIAAALNTAWHYRSMALAPSNSAGDRKFWLEAARSAVSRAREDRTRYQPALERMLRAANSLPAAVEALWATPYDKLMAKTKERV